jgi:hypothetical protein
MTKIVVLWWKGRAGMNKLSKILCLVLVVVMVLGLVSSALAILLVG